MKFNMESKMSTHKILFLDDEENVIRSLRRIFIDVDEYEIHTAMQGNEALDILKNNDIALIISDYRMPEMDGVEFLEKAKQIKPEAIRIILTGFADVEVAIAAINEGEIYKFIEKPWESEQLKIHIKRALELYDLKKERETLLETVSRQNEELKKFNTELEQIVEMKTTELKFKVQELKGRDKVLQNLLKVNTLEESLEFILQVIFETLPFDKILMYVAEENNMKVKSGMQKESGGTANRLNEIEKYPDLPILDLEEEGEEILIGKSDKNKINEFSYIIPIEKEHKCLGVILVDNGKSRLPVSELHLESLSGFATLTALAISDFYMTAGLQSSDHDYDELFKEFE